MKRTGAHNPSSTDEATVPKPVVTETVCSICAEPWEDHEPGAGVLGCIKLLKVKAKVKPNPANPYSIGGYNCSICGWWVIGPYAHVCPSAHRNRYLPGGQWYQGVYTTSFPNGYTTSPNSGTGTISTGINIGASPSGININDWATRITNSVNQIHNTKPPVER